MTDREPSGATERDPSARTRVVHAMGMPFTIEAAGLASDADFAAVTEAVHEDLEWANGVFSLWDPGTPLSRYARGDLALADCPTEVQTVLALCEQYREATGGAFDARSPSGAFDPSGVVKTWAVRRAALRLEAAGATDWMVGAAGDVVACPGGAARTLGIADPRRGGDPQGGPVIDVVTLDGTMRALATSGTAQHGAHIWDPRTREAANHVLQASVVGQDVVDCDAWATAVVAGGTPVIERALAQGLHVLIVTEVRSDGTLAAQASAGWPSTLA